MRNVLSFIFCIGICFLAAGIGSLFTTPAIPTWYASLHKPFFNPPNYIFGPVWSILYFLMGITLFIVLREKKKKTKAVSYFFIQLILNTLWSIIFFGLQSPIAGLLTILLLWAAIFITIREFITINKTAGYLLIPYLAWVSFATLLNLMIVILN